ncbi:MAG: DUF885 domain-containing protein [Pseudomonadota bacterium]
MKKLLKWAGIALGVFALAGGLFLAQTWYGKPLTINLFFARTALKFALESPEMLTSLHVLENIGIEGHNARLDDASLAAGLRTYQRVIDAHKTLLSYDDEDLSEADLMSKRVALSLLDIAVEGEQFRFHNYPVNQMFGVQNGFPSFMESSHQIHDLGDAEDYLSRLGEVPRKFGQVVEGLRYREAQGILPPQFVIDRVLTEMRDFVATRPADNILLTALEEKLSEAELPSEDAETLLAAAATAIDEQVYPAYQQLIDYFVELDDRVDASNGVWALPNGDAYYRLAIRFFTTTDLEPDYIHEFGLREVDRIQAEILAVLDGEGWDVSDGFQGAIDRFSSDPSHYYSDNGEGRDQILDDYRAMIEEINAGLDPYFDVRPKSAVEVKRVPEFREATAPGAYYSGPAIDGSRPGTFYANLYDIKATPRFGMRTLAYHEAVPGHHFQIAIQQELKGIPFFRRLIPFTAYAEGWALYAERLAWEAGFQNNPYDNIGRLQAELFRAVRLVVDTGIHHHRWTREAAIDYMLANTGMARSDVVSEIERYFVMPGQALAYKIGMTRILELRAKAREALGEKFDIRQFHNVVLTNGSVPLTILEELVDDYIAQTLAS